MSKVAVLIVTYNGERYINKCLSSLYKTETQIHVFLCDNGSTDNTLDIVNKYSSNITVITHPANSGFGAANNLLLARALKEDYDYFFFLNQDVYVDEDTIESLIHCLEINNNLGIVSPFNLNSNATSFDKHFSLQMQKIEDPDFLYDLYKNTLKPLYLIPFVNACAWMVPRRTIEKIGGFDPVFFHYGEDNNYCQRALYHGFTIGVCTSCSIRHDRDERVTHGWSEIQTEHHSLTWLIRASNILNNRGVEEAFRHALRIFFITAIKGFYNAELSIVMKSIFDLYYQIKLLQTVKQHRELNKKIDNNWINLTI